VTWKEQIIVTFLMQPRQSVGDLRRMLNNPNAPPPRSRAARPPPNGIEFLAAQRFPAMQPIREYE
jgi:hypothetical protein